MTRYVALLRDVNVGGTGKLPMAEVRAMCRDAGFTRVETYIASGNVVFESKASASKVKAERGSPFGLRQEADWSRAANGGGDGGRSQDTLAFQRSGARAARRAWRSGRVLAIGGAKSFRAQMAPIMQLAASNVRESIIPDSGHWIMEENPRATIAVMRAFLEA